MARCLLALALLLALVAAPVFAEANLITAGPETGDVSQLMSKAGYEETQLAMGSKEENVDLKMWAVGDRVLICSFSTTDNVVKGLSYFLCGDGPRAKRTKWSLRTLKTGFSREADVAGRSESAAVPRKRSVLRQA
ncbi:hypothetical protein ACFL59_12105 [Planctomycetota bacterium]